jgi:hypothetical protein
MLIIKKEKSRFLILLILPLLTITPFLSYGFGIGSPSCYELGTCDFFSSPFNTLILPYSEVFGPFIFVLVWALIIGILWLRLGNTMVVGMIGLALAAVFQNPLAETAQDVPFAGDAQLIGYVLLGVAVTVVIYQILAVRTRYPSN